jgi:hypothetical protein
MQAAHWWGTFRQPQTTALQIQRSLLTHVDVLQVQPDDLTLRSMDVSQLQKKLFPLHPVTLAEFKSNARIQDSSNSEINQRLMWRTMAEDLSEDQVLSSRQLFFTQSCHIWGF